MWNPNITFRPTCCNTTYNVPWYHKRKMDPDPEFDSSPPTKLLITEEKMISQLNGIHLSHDYTTHGTAASGSSSSEVDMDDSLNILGDRVNASSLPTLVVSDEIKELQKPLPSPLPKHLLDNFKSQSQALVLWKPPAGELGKYLMSLRNTTNTPNKDAQQQQQTTDVEMEDDDNNNGSTNQNLNGVFTRTI